MARHLTAPPETACGLLGDEFVLVRCRRSRELPPQGYCLDTRSLPATLEAGDDAGMFYGLQSLARMTCRSPGRLDGTVLREVPELPRRGYMLDVTRGKIPTMERCQALVRELARLRYNELQLYMEYTFAFPEDEDIWYSSDAFSPAQIQELDAFCQEHFITLTPNFNCFGHLTQWFGAERYRHLAECEHGWYYPNWDTRMHSVLAPGKDAEAFLRRHLDELLPNFTAPECNIGFDETFELGHGKSRAACKREGQGALFLQHLKSVCRIIARHGKSPIVWGDFLETHPELLPLLPKGILPIVWKYEQEDDFEAGAAALERAGLPFLVSPGTSGWTSLCGRTGNLLRNIDQGLAAALHHHGAGMLLVDWGDACHLQHTIISWPGMAYAALRAWDPSCDARALLPETMRTAFIPEQPHAALPRLLLELGRADEEFHHRTRAKTPFFLALLEDDSKLLQKFLQDATPEEIRATRRRLARLHKSFQTGDLPGGAQETREFANTLDLLAVTLEVLAKRLHCRQAGTALQREQLFCRTLAEFRELWLRRNRAGGLTSALSLLQGLQGKL